MRRRTEVDAGAIGRRLRRGDPAGDGREPATREISRMRSRIVIEAETRRFPPLLSLPAVALTVVAAASLLLGWHVARLSRTPGAKASRSVETHSMPDAGPNRAPERRVRQLQFSTPGGTRVVWLLDSDFEV